MVVGSWSRAGHDPATSLEIHMERRIIVTGRQGGKTTQMLQWVREAPEGEHRVLVCTHGSEAMRLLRENPDLESWQFVGLNEVKLDAWSGVLFGRGGYIVLGLDNIDLMLTGLLGWPVGAMSMTDGPQVDPSRPPSR